MQEKLCSADREGNYVGEYESIIDAARANGIASPYNISAAINGRQKTCGGYLWEYKETNGGAM